MFDSGDIGDDTDDAVVADASQLGHRIRDILLCIGDEHDRLVEGYEPPGPHSHLILEFKPVRTGQVSGRIVGMGPHIEDVGIIRHLFDAQERNRGCRDRVRSGNVDRRHVCVVVRIRLKTAEGFDNERFLRRMTEHRVRPLLGTDRRRRGFCDGCRAERACPMCGIEGDMVW